MYGFIQIDEKSPSGIHPRYHVVSELLHGVMLLDLLNGKLTDSDGKEVEFARKLYEQYNTDRYAFAIFIVKNILSGIMALHDKGFIHRDIDPSNVMVTSDGKVKIIDFGIAKQIDSLSADRHLTSTGQFMGKAAYAAPELVRGDVPHQNATTDIYAIGIVMFEPDYGKAAFRRPNGRGARNATARKAACKHNPGQGGTQCHSQGHGEEAGKQIPVGGGIPCRG